MAVRAGFWHKVIVYIGAFEAPPSCAFFKPLDQSGLFAYEPRSFPAKKPGNP
jgi:hypothetical protein